MAFAIFLFLIGLAAGSFINVVAMRYKDGGRLFTADVLTGRSHCHYCGQTLRWYELVPLLSFIFQFGRCRHCRHALSWQYPIVELLGGLTFLLVPGFVEPAPLGILVVLTLILITLIDLRLSIIPDQLNLFLVLLGLITIFLPITNYQLLITKVIGVIFGLFFFGLIILFTRGKGMGFGDLKLAGALGLLFGWPKILLIVAVAFAVGGVVALVLLLLKKKSLRQAIPFGPFLALASVLVIFFGDAILNRYSAYLNIYF